MSIHTIYNCPGIDLMLKVTKLSCELECLMAEYEIARRANDDKEVERVRLCMVEVTKQINAASKSSLEMGCI